MNLITRQEAISSGEKYFYTGILCKRGHKSKRIVANYACHACHKENQQAKRIADGCIPRAKTIEQKLENRKATIKKYADNNKEKIKQSQIKYKENHPDRRKDTCKRWSESNKEYIRIKAQNRRHKLIGKLSKNLATKLFELQKGKCPACKKKLGKDYHLDHIVPIALNGSNTDNNIQLLHSKCNLKKTDRNPIEFMQTLGYLL